EITSGLDAVTQKQSAPSRTARVRILSVAPRRKKRRKVRSRRPWNEPLRVQSRPQRRQARGNLSLCDSRRNRGTRATATLMSGADARRSRKKRDPTPLPVRLFGVTRRTLPGALLVMQHPELTKDDECRRNG